MLWYIFDVLYNADQCQHRLSSQCVHTEKICVVGFLHHVLADILCVKTALGLFF